MNESTREQSWLVLSEIFSAQFSVIFSEQEKRNGVSIYLRPLRIWVAAQLCDLTCPYIRSSPCCPALQKKGLASSGFEDDSSKIGTDNTVNLGTKHRTKPAKRTKFGANVS